MKLQAARTEDNSHLSDPCVVMTSDDQLHGGAVVRRLSADDVTDRDDWRVMDEVEDAEERWNANDNDHGVIVGGPAGLIGLRRDSAPEMSHAAFGSDDGDRLQEDTDNEDNIDDDSNAPVDDPDVQVAMATGPAAAAAAARWLFPAAIAAQPLGARMLPSLPCAPAPPSQSSVIGRDSNVKLAAMENTDVAVAQFAENNMLPADVAALNVVLWNLHQQQMFQMHMILQLQQQILYATATSGGVGAGSGVVGGLPAAATAACTADPQRNATLPDVLQNNKIDDSSLVLDPTPAASASAPGFRDALYKPLVPGESMSTATTMEKSADIASSTPAVDAASAPRSEIRSPVTYVSAPSVTTVPPMLAMMDMSLGRLEPPAKERMIFASFVTVILSF